MGQTVTISNNCGKLGDPEKRWWNLRFCADGAKIPYFQLIEQNAASYAVYRVYYSEELIQGAHVAEDTDPAVAPTTEVPAAAAAAQPPLRKFNLDLYLRRHLFKINTLVESAVNTPEDCQKDPVDPVSIDSMYKTLIYWLVMNLTGGSSGMGSFLKSPNINLCRDVMEEYCEDLYPPSPSMQAVATTPSATTTVSSTLEAC